MVRSTDYQRFWENPSYAFVGHSAKTGFPKISFGEMVAQGREVFAVDPSVQSVEGQQAYSDFDSLPHPVSAAVLEVPKDETAAWIEKAAEAGIKQVWIHSGRETEQALELADDRGMTVFYGTCAVMYLKKGFSYHSIHRWINKAIGKF